MTVQQQPPTLQQSTTPSPQTLPLPREGINVGRLGSFVDGWSELIEGMGSKAEQVRSEVLEHLKARNMPNIGLGNNKGYVSLTSSEERDYVIAQRKPGAITTIYIAQHGVDLYASWRTYYSSPPNKELLYWVLGGSAFLGLFPGGFGIGSIFDSYGNNFSFFGWILSTIIFILLASYIMVLAGNHYKGDPRAFFYKNKTVFDADDITAMSLSVHKSVIRSLDKSGIDVSKLRLKQTFKGDRSDI